MDQITRTQRRATKPPPRPQSPSHCDINISGCPKGDSSVRRLLFSTVSPHSAPRYPLCIFSGHGRGHADSPDDTQRPDGVDPQTATHLFGPTALFTSRENPIASALRFVASTAPLLTCSCPLSRRGLLRLTLLPFKVCLSAFPPCLPRRPLYIPPFLPHNTNSPVPTPDSTSLRTPLGDTFGFPGQ